MIEQALDFRDESDALFALLESLGDSDWNVKHEFNAGRLMTSWLTFIWATTPPIFH